ncbi:Hsp70 family protein [Pontibacter sp. HSC-14F20]|uniref:Hsp70 family protein n=1 Tax=Pontibacter sp. HSC-14F20 TaxID=2864136 RepID=UPI001C72A303|nr:Hsp70 family protein [Pontibacter sp. HSC-14F20]MBX0332960.1 Hsp70 family protein [Pontibacter sp. HSC-14F20]
MSTEISVQNLVPVLQNPQLAQSNTDLSNKTFIGIDFGTSTTVVTIATLTNAGSGIDTKAIWLNQKLIDGRTSSERIPTVIAWYNNQLLIGQGAADLKYLLKKGVNVWYSFKMELGEDIGPKYFNSQLNKGSKYTIYTPKDAAKIFFKFIKAQIDHYIEKHNLPTNLHFAVSIPASFEANQRKELVQALEQNGIAINKQALIDEPNAAFLSYVQQSSKLGNALKLPDSYNLNTLVFDFGAGTCDVSVLEVGKDHKGVYSKNLSISKFEKLGGDDIDRYIVLEYLLPQLYEENGFDQEDFRTPEINKNFIPKLMKTAEELKISICNKIGLLMQDRILPSTAVSSTSVSLGYTIEIDSRKGKLTLTEPKLTYKQFADVMAVFTKTGTKTSTRKGIGQDEFISIYNPIYSALNKANLDKKEVDYVLFIGGSSKNPYIQASLKEYFKDSDLLIPSDLQTHVSAGAAIHSLVYNGLNKNIIQPITSEPLLVITKDETPKVILRAGTSIPCDLIVIDDLVTHSDGQQAIELPICLGNINKLLFNIKIVSPNQEGFKRNTPVRLELEINSDKLLLARASAAGQTCEVKPMNPFANKELTAEERIVLQAERQANLEAEKNGGKPTEKGLRELVKAYEKVESYLRAAETLELLNELYPKNYNYNHIGVLFSMAGHEEKSLEYYELGYQNAKNAKAAFNYAYKLKYKNPQKSKELLQEALNIDPEDPHCCYELGSWYKKEGNPEGVDMIRRAFETWKKEFESNQLSKTNHSWLSSAAEKLGMRAFAQQVREATPRFEGDNLYNSENLTQTIIEGGLIKA